MNVDFEMVDLRTVSDEERAHWAELGRLIFTFNHSMPGSEEYLDAMKGLFGDLTEKYSMVMAPVSGSCLDRVKIGKTYM